MKEGKTIKGYFYLPDNPENEIAGILYFVPGVKIFLELIGGLGKNEGFVDFFSSKSEKIIWGDSSDAQQITLINCTISQSLNTSSKFPLTNYNCQYLVVGSHVSSLEEKKFDYLTTGISDLYDWKPLNVVRFSTNFSVQNEIEAANFSMSFKNKNEDEFSIGSDSKLKFISNSGFKTDFNGKNHSLTEDTLVKINKCEGKESIFFFLNKLELFKQFLSLARLSPVEYLEISFYDFDNYQEIQNGKRVYHETNFYSIERESYSDTGSKNFLFKYDQVKEDFQAIITKWYETTDTIAPIRNHLIESIRPKRSFNSGDFLIIIQALEGYHYRFLAKDPKKQINLAIRIEEIILRYSDIKKIQDKEIKIIQAVTSRHYYSHLGKKKANVLDGSGLYFLTQQLRQLLICCVLESVGIRNELINEILNNQD